MDITYLGFAIKVSRQTDKFAWQAASPTQQLASLPGVFWLSESDAIGAAKDEIFRHESKPEIIQALQTAQSWLQHAYCLSRSGYCEQEQWAIDLADSLHHAQESLEKLNQEASNDWRCTRYRQIY